MEECKALPTSRTYAEVSHSGVSMHQSIFVDYSGKGRKTTDQSMIDSFCDRINQKTCETMPLTREECESLSLPSREVGKILR